MREVKGYVLPLHLVFFSSKDTSMALPDGTVVPKVLVVSKVLSPFHYTTVKPFHLSSRSVYSWKQLVQCKNLQSQWLANY